MTKQSMTEQLRTWNEREAKLERIQRAKEEGREMLDCGGDVELSSEGAVSGVYGQGMYEEDEELSFEARCKWFKLWIAEPIHALKGLETTRRIEFIGGEQEVRENIRAREMISSVLNHLWYTRQLMDRWLGEAQTKVEAAGRGDTSSEIGARKFEGAVERLQQTVEAAQLNEAFMHIGRGVYDESFHEPWSPRVARGTTAGSRGTDPAVQALLEQAKNLRIGDQSKRKPALDPRKVAEALEQSARKRVGAQAEQSIDDHEAMLNHSAA